MTRHFHWILVVVALASLAILGFVAEATRCATSATGSVEARGRTDDTSDRAFRATSKPSIRLVKL
jgi:hypothetical protein